MLKQEYFNALDSIRCYSCFEYVVLAKPIHKKRYDYLKSKYPTLSSFKVAYKKGFIDRYELAGGDLHREYLKT